MVAPLTDTRRIDVSSALASALLKGAQNLPHYENREFYSPELQTFVRDSVRDACPDDFDWLINLTRERLAQWPYWVLLKGLRFDEENRLFVAINRAFGELVAGPYEAPRAQLVHYIQPSTDITSSRGGRESERLHTDTADWDPPVKLISMVCVRADPVGGGRSRLLDVDSVRDEVRTRLGTETLELLETSAVPWKLADYFGGGVAWRTVLTESSICWRRYTIDFALNSQGVRLPDEMLASLDAFENLLAATTRTQDFLMGEGELLFGDNTRTIHARTPIGNDNASDRLMIRSWIRAD